MQETEKSVHISTYARPTMVDLNDNKGRFEPTTNKHQWNRWRMAVNDALCQHVTHADNADWSDNKDTSGKEPEVARINKSLTDVPFKESVVVNMLTQLHAKRLMTPDGGFESQGHLNTRQFVYFGIPRATLKRKDTNDGSTGPRRMNVFIPADMPVKGKFRRSIIKRGQHY